MRQAIQTDFANRHDELQRLHDAKEITVGQYIAERAKALRIYTAALALEEYRMNRITQVELIEKLNQTFKRKAEND